MPAVRRWPAIAGLAVAAFVSLSLGVTSDGARGLLLGMLVPAVCVGAVAAIDFLFPALVVAALAWLGGVEVAARIGSNLDGTDVIDLLPLGYGVVLLGAACVGLFARLAADSIHDRSPRRPRA